MILGMVQEYKMQEKTLDNRIDGEASLTDRPTDPLDFGFYNMNCFEALKNIPDKYFDLLLCDPPYGSLVGKGGYQRNTMTGGLARRRKYHSAVWDMERPSKEQFAELTRVSKNQIIFGGNYFADLLEPSQGWIVWDKVIPNGVTFADCELAWTSFNRPIKQFTFQWSGMLQGDMKHKEVKIHPCMKPTALFEWILQNYANEGDTVLDPFAGSASCGVACHNTNHKWMGFEIDKTYYDLAKKRLDAETAQMNIFDFGIK